MKKILIVLGIVAAFITATAFVSVDRTNALPGPGGMCKVVGNCTVEISSQGDGNYRVKASNNNNYKVTVEWTAIGYKDGKRRQVGGGTLALNPSGNNGDRQSSSFSTSCEDVSLDAVRVLKCD